MQKKKLPVFKNENEEREFWMNNDSSDFFDWEKSLKNVQFPNLKLSTKTISLRLTESMLGNIKILANKRDIPYQSYIKVILDEKIREEMKR